jgi:hypothetical protein
MGWGDKFSYTPVTRDRLGKKRQKKTSGSAFGCFRTEKKGDSHATVVLIRPILIRKEAMQKLVAHCWLFSSSHGLVEKSRSIGGNEKDQIQHHESNL